MFVGIHAFLLGCPVCCGSVTLSFSPVVCSDCCGQGLVPLLLVGQSRTTWGFTWVRPGICQRCSSTALQDTFPVCPLGSFCWWAEPAFRAAICPQCWGHSLVCTVTFPSPWGRSRFGVALAPSGPLVHCQACGTALGGLQTRGQIRVGTA